MAGQGNGGRRRPSARARVSASDVKKAPAKKAPAKKAPAKKAPTKKAPAKKAPAKKAPAKKAPAKKARKKAPAKKAPKKAPAKKAPAKKAPAKKAPAKKAPVKKAPAKKAPKKAPAKKAPAKKAPVKKIRETRRAVGPKAEATPPPRPGPVPRAPAATGPLPSVKGDAVGARAGSQTGAILITGICGRLGRLLARHLHRVDRVVGIDRRPFPGRPKDIVHHQIDVRRKKTRDLFRSGQVRAVVHLGVLHDPRASDKEHHSWNVVAFQKLLDYLTQYDVPKLVVLSSANVYGPQPDNPQFMTEEAPLLGAQQFRGIRDLVEMDMLAQSFFWRHPQTDTVILRPVHILGAVRNAASNYLRLERPMTLMGFDPMVQPIHERDVRDAIVAALEPGVRGIFNLRGPGELPLSRILRILGRRPRTVPGPMAAAALERMFRYRLTSFPSPELDHIRFLCMVDDTRAREVLGFRPTRSMRETLEAVDADR